MTVRALASRCSHELRQGIARLFCARIGAGLVGATGPVDLARGDPRKTNARPFGAPDWTVTVPHVCGRACEGLPGRNYRGGSKQEKAHAEVYGAGAASKPRFAQSTFRGLSPCDK